VTVQEVGDPGLAIRIGIIPEMQDPSMKDEYRLLEIEAIFPPGIILHEETVRGGQCIEKEWWRGIRWKISRRSPVSTAW
jgi:hypothetical protein